MASKRCSLCGISYPNEWGFEKCPLHKTVTWHDPAPPDADWEYQVKRLAAQMQRDAEVAELIPGIEGKVFEADGQLWVSSHDVIRSDIGHRLEPDSLIRIGSEVFEIMAYVYGRRAYIVEPFSIELTDEAIGALLGGE